MSGLLWAEDFPATSVLVFGYWAGQSHLEGVQVELLLLNFSLIFFVDGPQHLGHLLVVVLPSLGGPLILRVWFAIATLCRNATVLLRLLSVNTDVGSSQLWSNAISSYEFVFKPSLENDGL